MEWQIQANRQAGLSPEENIQKIIEYSTLPGTSRHHWGTEIDIIDGTIQSQGDVLLAEKFHEGGLMNAPYLAKKMRQPLDLFVRIQTNSNALDLITNLGTTVMLLYLDLYTVPIWIST